MNCLAILPKHFNVKAGRCFHRLQDSTIVALVESQIVIVLWVISHALKL